MSAINWSMPVVTRHGHPGRVLEERTLSGRRRVWVCKYNPPKTDDEAKTGTAWNYAEDGSCRGDGAPSDLDIVGNQP